MSSPFRDPHGAHRNAGIPVSGARWSGFESRGEDLRGMVFHECGFEDVSFTGCRLEQTIFVECVLDGVSVAGGTLDQTQWVKCTGRGLRIESDSGTPSETPPQAIVAESELGELVLAARAERVMIGDCRLDALVFEGSGLEQYAITVSGGEIGRVHAARVRWRMASVLGARLAHWDLSGALLTQCAFLEASGEEADLGDVTFRAVQPPPLAVARRAPSPHRGLHLLGVRPRGGGPRGRRRARGAAGPLRPAGARGSPVRSWEGALLSESDLRDAELSSARAPRSAWIKSDLRGAVLDRLHAPWSSFAHARFAGATVDGARLESCDLHGATDLPPGALTAGARGTIEWRAELERGLGARTGPGLRRLPMAPTPSSNRPADPLARSVLERLLAPEPDRARSDPGALAPATVRTWTGAAGVLEDGSPALLAASCLLVPAPADQVLVWREPSGPMRVLAVLSRPSSAPARLQLGDSATLAAGTLEIDARRIQQSAGEVLVSAREHHEVLEIKSSHVRTRVAEVETDVRRARHASDEVRGTLLQRAGAWVAHTLREARLSARATLFD